MALLWIHENPAVWDADKARIVGRAPAGIFDSRFSHAKIADLIPGEWWRVEEDGRTIGYGWLDVNWGDAEILLSTDPEVRGRGVGSFIVVNLDKEARARGLNYLYNEVRSTHPDAERVTEWFERHGFSRSVDGRLLRAVVRPSQLPPPPAPR